LTPFSEKPNLNGRLGSEGEAVFVITTKRLTFGN
jgi:hypothetical protein